MGAQNPTQLANPSLFTKELADIYVRKNFENLSAYFQSQNQLYGFNFLELNITGAVTNKTFAHGIGYAPQDIIVSRITGAGQISFNYNLFDKTNINVTTTGTCRVRLFVGSYWNYQSNANNLSTDIQSFQAALASPSSTSSAYANKAPNFRVLTSGTTFGLSYYFTAPGTTALTGAKYTNNGQTFTVVDSVTNASMVMCTSTGAPTSTGRLDLSSGSGTGTLFFTAVQAPLYMVVECVGGGGGGGNSTTCAAGQNSGGSGGGAGGYCKKRFANPSATYTYGIGPGSAGGGGGNGGSTTFSTLNAGGGATGASAGVTSGGPVFISGSGGAGGTATGGDLNIPGGQGSPAIVLGIGQASQGAGGNSFWGIAQQAGINAGTSVGAAGQNYGAGGGGGLTLASAGGQFGGAGGPGAIAIWEHFQ